VIRGAERGNEVQGINGKNVISKARDKGAEDENIIFSYGGEGLGCRRERKAEAMDLLESS